MAKTVMVTSLKGGVGKSTVAAGISTALALSGKRVLSLDFDFDVRSLELIMGVESKTVFNSLDVLEGRCPLGRAVVTHERVGGLYLLAAPSLSCSEASRLDFKKLFCQLNDFVDDGKELDYIIIDAQAKDEDVILAVSPYCDTVLVPCSHSPASERAAELTGERLSRVGAKEIKLVVNGFDAEGVLRSDRVGVAELIDSTRLMLLGVVPYDSELELLEEKGELVDVLPKSSNTRRAFANIAVRLDGGQVPLFDGFSGSLYKKVLQIKMGY